MNSVIIYKGRYGATQQYTQWVAEELRLPVFAPEAISEHELSSFDLIITGSSVYMGRLLIKDWLKENMMILRNKRLLLYIVCATPASEEQKRREIMNTNIPAQLLNHMAIFFFPGRLVIGKLSWKDRLLLKLGSMMEKDPVKKKAMRQDVDEVKRENIAGLIKATRELSTKGMPASVGDHAYHIL